MQSNPADNNKPYRSLSRNIIFITLIASITPMIIVSMFILNDFRATYLQRIQDNFALTALNHRKSINLFLKEKLSNIRHLATQYDYTLLKQETFLTQKLVELQQAYDRVFVDLGVVNHKGIQVSYAGPHALSHANYSEAEWFKQAIKTAYFTSDVFYGLRGSPHFIVTVRHYVNNQPWIIRATIDFGSFNNLVENLRIGRTGFAFIVNKAGEFQTKPIAKTHLPPDILGTFIANNFKEAPEVITKKDLSGKEIFYSSVMLKDNEWIMILQQDLKDAYADLYHTQRVALAIILIGGIGITLTALLLSRRLIKRIAKADWERNRSDKEKEKMSQQVIESNKLASIGELAAGIAHEINNPVAIMVEEAGWIEDLLEEEEFQEGQNLMEFRRALQQINNQGKRCKDITHKLLSFARKTDPRVHEIVINECLDEVVYLSHQRAKYSNISIKTDFEENLPIIWASETELQQVLFNIVNNSLDAMEKSGGEIVISSKVDDEKNIAVIIEDTGPGIAQANLNRIFDPFFTTKPVGKGTGLGLSICYGIINKMGGGIDVQSEMNKGTRFTIRIPCIKNAD
ncbi:MAG: ATP-binding protein [Desulfobacteraceae bacterium]|jgi:two-component system NtrC family sensor kinase